MTSAGPGGDGGGGPPGAATAAAVDPSPSRDAEGGTEEAAVPDERSSGGSESGNGGAAAGDDGGVAPPPPPIDFPPSPLPPPPVADCGGGGGGGGVGGSRHRCWSADGALPSPSKSGAPPPPSSSRAAVAAAASASRFAAGVAAARRRRWHRPQTEDDDEEKEEEKGEGKVEKGAGLEEENAKKSPRPLRTEKARRKWGARNRGGGGPGEESFGRGTSPVPPEGKSDFGADGEENDEKYGGDAGHLSGRRAAAAAAVAAALARGGEKSAAKRVLALRKRLGARGREMTEPAALSEEDDGENEGGSDRGQENDGCGPNGREGSLEPLKLEGNADNSSDFVLPAGAEDNCHDGSCVDAHPNREDNVPSTKPLRTESSKIKKLRKKLASRKRGGDNDSRSVTEHAAETENSDNVAIDSDGDGDIGSEVGINPQISSTGGYMHDANGQKREVPNVSINRTPRDFLPIASKNAVHSNHSDPSRKLALPQAREKGHSSDDFAAVTQIGLGLSGDEHTLPQHYLSPEEPSVLLPLASVDAADKLGDIDRGNESNSGSSGERDNTDDRMTDQEIPLDSFESTGTTSERLSYCSSSLLANSEGGSNEVIGGREHPLPPQTLSLSLPGLPSLSSSIIGGVAPPEPQVLVKDAQQTQNQSTTQYLYDGIATSVGTGSGKLPGIDKVSKLRRKLHSNLRKKRRQGISPRESERNRQTNGPVPEQEGGGHSYTSSGSDLEDIEVDTRKFGKKESKDKPQNWHEEELTLLEGSDHVHSDDCASRRQGSNTIKVRALKAHKSDDDFESTMESASLADEKEKEEEEIIESSQGPVEHALVPDHVSPTSQRGKIPYTLELLRRGRRKKRTVSPVPLPEKATTPKRLRVKPHSAYPKAYMTEDELHKETLRPSENYEHLQSCFMKDYLANGDDKTHENEVSDDGRIGTFSVEVLACVGLPRTDRFIKPDIMVYLVLGDCAFSTDVVKSSLSPLWPAKSCRAAIFPVYHAFARLYMGVFNVGRKEKENDDFMGRVVVDIATLRPGTAYDVMLPLRASESVYDRRPRGVVRLRFSLMLESQRRAVLSYLWPVQGTSAAGQLQIPCADAKTFRNVAMLVHGQDLPGLYTRQGFKATNKEAALYQVQLSCLVFRLVNGAVSYEQPIISFYLFAAWMQCVYQNSVGLVPFYFVGYVLLLHLHNYVKFQLDPARYGGFAPVTLSEIFLALVGVSKTLEPLQVGAPPGLTNFVFDGPNWLDQPNLPPLDHIEFPFSEGNTYKKFTLKEAIAQRSKRQIVNSQGGPQNSRDAYAVLNEEEDSILNEDEESDYDMEEYDTSSGRVQQPSFFFSYPGSEISIPVGPNQNVDIIGPKPVPFKHNLAKFEAQFHRLTMHLFDDQVCNRRMKGKPTPLGSATATRDATMPQVVQAASMGKRIFDEFDKRLGLHTRSQNPVVALTADYLRPVMSMVRIWLKIVRVSFNVFAWKDPYLSFWALCSLIGLMFILSIFPWQQFMFLVGIILLGPQNLFIVGVVNFRRKRKGGNSSGPSGGDNSGPMASQGSKKQSAKSKLTTLVRREKKQKSVTSDEEGGGHAFSGQPTKRSPKPKSEISRSIMVPYSRLRKERFYDWPPALGMSSATPLVRQAHHPDNPQEINDMTLAGTEGDRSSFPEEETS